MKGESELYRKDLDFMADDCFVIVVTCPSLEGSFPLFIRYYYNWVVNGSAVNGRQPVNTQAGYSCWSGYRLSAFHSSICLASGTWNWQPPRCIG